MHVICLNGPINAGKSTVGRALAAALPEADFVEGDDHGVPEGTPFLAMLEIAVERLAQAVLQSQRRFLVLAYPLREEDFARLAAAAGQRGARLSVVTLAPPLSVLLSDRGGRALSDEELARSREMVEEGYAQRPFSELVLDGALGVEATVRQVMEGLGLGA